LVKVEPQTQEKAGAGATKPDQTDIKGKLVDYSWWLKKNGYAESTIITNTKILKTLVKRGASLLDSESIKEVIAKQEWDSGTKAIAVWAYDSFAKKIGLTWERPTYKQTQKIPFIPMETEIDQLIAGCGKKTATFTQAVKETGARPGEVWQLKWVDIDTVNNVVRINEPEKNSNPRIIRVSNKLMAMFNMLPRKSEKVFKQGCLRQLRRTFGKQRESIAKKLQNPRIQKTTWCSIRHWKGTMEYHKTKDILHVMKVLGHKNIRNTLIYINLENTIFQTQNDDFTVRVANTSEEIQQLLEVGFEYVCEKDALLYFRKRK